LKHALGVAATTCSYRDWIGSDLIVFIGCNVANSQPVAVKYLHYAKKAGTRIGVVNSFAEPGMQRYWVPSVPESALFGTKLADRTFLIHTGGDIAFLNGAIKHMIAHYWVDWNFIRERTDHFQELAQGLEQQSWEELERAAGATQDEMLAFARMIHEARTAVLVWSMGVTQHEFGEDTVSAIVNLALTRGFVGREKCGLMPIRGHSGVQGGAEMGAYATAFPGGLAIDPHNAARLSDLYGFPVPSSPGLTAPQMIDAAHEGRLDLLLAAGGNFLDVLPEPDYVREALEAVPLRVHLDLVVNRQMLLEAGEAVVLLPAATRYEGPGAVTQTSTERRVILSPEIRGPRPAEARQEWQVFTELARRARPMLAGLLDFKDTAAIRAEIGRVIPEYAGIERLEQPGDQFQYGGPQLCWEWQFPTPDGKARFTPVAPPRAHLPEGAFMVSTRRGKQFNSMVHEARDQLTGAGRETVLISPADAGRLGLRDGDRVRLSNPIGSFTARAQVAPVRPGNLQLHWPEGNVLIDRHRRSPKSGIPDYNAVVWLEKLEVPDAATTGE
jgi:molybdopterin-dependent oxidoreductase alpha subunit